MQKASPVTFSEDNHGNESKKSYLAQNRVWIDKKTKVVVKSGKYNNSDLHYDF